MERSKIVSRTYVESKHIENLSHADFDGINIRFKEPISICFYNETKTSQFALQMFVSAADSVEGFKFGVVNMDTETELCKRFKELDDEDHPYHWVHTTDMPFILTYRSGFPQAFYNGNLDDKIMKYYFENLAHVKGHKEGKIADPRVKYQSNRYLRLFYD